MGDGKAVVARFERLKKKREGISIPGIDGKGV